MSKQQTLTVTWNTFKEKKPQDTWKIFVKEKDDDPGAMYAASVYKDRLMIQFTSIEKEINPEWQWFYASELEQHKQNNMQAKVEFNPKTIKIGDTEWMAENLSYDDGGDGITYNSENKKYYYTLEAAKRVADKLGWKLPSDEDWDKACEECSGIRDEKEYWYSYDNCSLKKKLNINLDGIYSKGFYYIGSYGYFWSSSENSSSYAWYRYFDTSSSVARSNNDKTYGFSVRLVKEAI